MKSKLSAALVAFMHYRCNNVAPAQGRADFIFQDLTTFNLGRFDGPTDLTFSPSAIFISH
jgi:hypothetical protein